MENHLGCAISRNLVRPGKFNGKLSEEHSISDRLNQLFLKKKDIQTFFKSMKNNGENFSTIQKKGSPRNEYQHACKTRDSPKTDDIAEERTINKIQMKDIETGRFEKHININSENKSNCAKGIKKASVNILKSKILSNKFIDELLKSKNKSMSKTSRQFTDESIMPSNHQKHQPLKMGLQENKNEENFSKTHSASISKILKNFSKTKEKSQNSSFVCQNEEKRKNDQIKVHGDFSNRTVDNNQIECESGLLASSSNKLRRNQTKKMFHKKMISDFCETVEKKAMKTENSNNLIKNQNQIFSQTVVNSPVLAKFCTPLNKYKKENGSRESSRKNVNVLGFGSFHQPLSKELRNEGKPVSIASPQIFKVKTKPTTGFIDYLSPLSTKAQFRYDSIFKGRVLK